MIANLLPKGISRRLRYRDDAGLIVRARQTAARLQTLSDAQLQQHVERLRESVLAGVAVTEDEVLQVGFALVNEGLRRTFGFPFYDVQLLAGLILTRGGIAEMATGEGKTLTAALPAFMHALRGCGVHIASANAYLAERDHAQLRPLFELLGLSCGHAADRAARDVKRAAYDCDITYATGHEFGFDYLRDQVAVRQQRGGRLGTDFSQCFRQRSERLRMQRGLAFAIVDEVDNILLDDAVSPLLLSEATAPTAADAELYVTAVRLARTFEAGVHYQFDSSSRHLHLLRNGLDQAYQQVNDLPVHLLQRPWTQYVEQALRSLHLMQRDVHYVLTAGEVQIVDESTGRIFTDRTWRDGLHQAVEAREGLNVTCEKRALARITRQRFYQLYGSLCGMTGTATGSEREFRQVYDVDVAVVPLRTPSRRTLLPTRYFANRPQKWGAIANEIQRRSEIGQPILVGTRSIADSLDLAALLNGRKLSFNLLNGRQDRNEAEIIAAAGEINSVTIATNLAGRGTDIKVSPEALELGGLHVIATERHRSHRVDRQLIGRCGRQGDPGSAQFFVSADDELIQAEAPGLVEAMRRMAGSGDGSKRFDQLIQNIQRRVELRSTQQRTAMLRADLERDSVVAKLGGEQI